MSGKSLGRTGLERGRVEFRLRLTRAAESHESLGPGDARQRPADRRAAPEGGRKQPLASVEVAGRERHHAGVVVGAGAERRIAEALGEVPLGGYGPGRLLVSAQTREHVGAAGQRLDLQGGQSAVAHRRNEAVGDLERAFEVAGAGHRGGRVDPAVVRAVVPAGPQGRLAPGQERDAGLGEAAAAQ